MKLKSFRIKNYKSIQDTGDIQLDGGRIAVLAGQNESGKSSILEAINAFEQGSFENDSAPFDSEETIQEIVCTYALEDIDDEFWESVEDVLAVDFKLKHEGVGDVIDIKKVKSAVREFTIIRSIDRAGEEGAKISLNKNVFQIINSAILETEIESQITKEDGTIETKKEKKKLIELEGRNNEIADIVWRQAPRVVLFNDFCDLLPDTFSIADLKADNKDAKGYNAIKNFEKIAGVDFLKLYSLDDLKRDSVGEKHNESISVDFTKAWKQQIHTDNKVKIAYNFEKRDTEENSFVVFYVETKDKQKIRPRMRSKGLVWFLSFWMELQASGNDNNLIILADEPGLYLHIRAQEDIIDVFEKLAIEGHQIIYSTHSPNLIKSDHLERISLVINDKNKGTIIEGVTTSKINSQNKQDALQPVANAIGFSVSGFALTSKKSVLLEGISDCFYYLGMRKILNRKDSYAFIPGIGVRKQQTLISFCIGYGIDWVAVFDDDSTRGSDSQRTFEDIEHHLFDGDHVTAETKMYITASISSVENMFAIDDIKLIDSKITVKSDSAKTIGEKRKVLFAKIFYEKVENGEISKKSLQPSTVKNFNNVFDWIDRNLGL